MLIVAALWSKWHLPASTTTTTTRSMRGVASTSTSSRSRSYWMEVGDWRTTEDDDGDGQLLICPGMCPNRLQKGGVARVSFLLDLAMFVPMFADLNLNWNRMLYIQMNFNLRVNGNCQPGGVALPVAVAAGEGPVRLTSSVWHWLVVG